MLRDLERNRSPLSAVMCSGAIQLVQRDFDQQASEFAAFFECEAAAAGTHKETAIGRHHNIVGIQSRSQRRRQSHAGQGSCIHLKTISRRHHPE
jgi:hypothetical protein